ncbi:MAG: hypothetical protein EHM21_03825 [Chloroflexi bacterium]|nr:MAG: hypothetical protein EHM21_03825 [Chloroflexota bacterium]
MPEPKKKQQTFDAEADSQLNGLQLVRAQRPAGPKTGQRSKTRGAGDAAGTPTEVQPPEPALVSKLIDFIKSI